MSSFILIDEFLPVHVVFIRMSLGETSIGSSCHIRFTSLLVDMSNSHTVCYETFENELRPTLRSIHGTQTHTGRAPHGISGKNEKKRKLESLRTSLENAIAHEEFEEAARLRDEIRELERDM